MAVDNARRICEAAAAAGTTVTLDMEDHSTTDLTLDAVRDLREDFPWVGAVLQAYLRRTEADCVDLADAGQSGAAVQGRVQGAARRSPGTTPSEVDRNYVRCLKVLMAGEGYPMVASHDPRLIEIAGALASRWRRPAGHASSTRCCTASVREEQRRLAAGGASVRVYLPYGSDWYALLHAAAGRTARPT